MIKLIPLIIFPLSFFLIFLGVKNLTVNLPSYKENIVQNNKEETVQPNRDSDKIEKKIAVELEKNLINNEQLSINVDENLQRTDEKEPKIIEVENAKEGFEKTKLQVKPEKKKNIKTTNNTEVAEKNKNNYLIQFGAFTKKKMLRT